VRTNALRNDSGGGAEFGLLPLMNFIPHAVAAVERVLPDAARGGGGDCHNAFVLLQQRLVSSLKLAALQH
jgi:hypothetical protein